MTTIEFSGPFGNAPWVLIFLPIILLAFDVAYKWGIYGHPPYDSVADVALAGLTFNAVHVVTHLTYQLPINRWAFIWVTLQFGFWPLCLFWARYLKRVQGRRPLYLSYVVGAIWFAYSTTRVLTLTP